MTQRVFQRSRWSVAFALLLGALVRPALADVVLQGAWVAEPPPGALSTAAFGVLTNEGPEVAEVVAASSPACERVEMHRTTEREGVVGMEQLDRITLAPGETVRFEPGSLHWMLIRPRPLAQGEEVELTLELADGSQVRLRLPVERRGAAPHNH
jgi:copper(I)-binding protein